MTERRIRPEARPQPQETSETLDVKGFGGLYGRFLIASQAPIEQVGTIINPDIEAGAIDTSLIDVAKDRDYNPITQKLSSSERVSAWQGADFNAAYKDWRTKLTSSIKDTKDEKKAHVIMLVSGKKISEFSEEDTDRLFDAFCKKQSDTTAFATTLIDGLKIEGKVDTKKLAELSGEIEWFSQGFFGKQTAVAVSKIIELESEIANNPTTVVERIFSDKNRVDDLTSKEKEILSSLSKGVAIAKTEAKPEVTQPKSKPGEIPVPNVGEKLRTKKGNPIEIVGAEERRYGDILFQVKKDNGIVENWSTERLAENLGVIITAKAEAEPVETVTPTPAETPVRDAAAVAEPIIDIPAASTESTEPKPKTINPKDISKLVGHRLQYEGEPHDITSVDAENVYLSTPNGQPRTVKVPHFIEYLGAPDSRWNLIDPKGERVIFKADEEEAEEDSRLTPPPINLDREEIPAETATPSESALEPEGEPESNPKPHAEDAIAAEVIVESKPRENVILLESAVANFLEKLNANLSTQTESDVTFSIPIETLKGYLISSAAGEDIQFLSAIKAIPLPDNVISITGLKFKSKGKTIDLSLHLVNNEDSIGAVIDKLDIGGMLGVGNGIAKEKIINGLANLTASFKEHLDKDISQANPSWESKTVAIDGERIKVGFHATNSAKAA